MFLTIWNLSSNVFAAEAITSIRIKNEIVSKLLFVTNTMKII